MKAKISFRGRRQWPQAISYPPTPSRRVGSWRKRAPGTRATVEELFSRAWGGLGWGTEELLGSPGVSAGGCAIRCSPHTPRRFPRGWEGQGSTRVRLRAARRVFGIPGSDSGCHFRPSKHYFRPTLALRRARQASDPAKLIEVEGQDFFSGSAAVAAGHLVSADPVERVGSWKKRGRDSRSSVKRCFQEEKGGRWAGKQIRELGHR